MLKRIHYGWIICAGCMLLMFVSTGLVVNSYSVYVPYIIDSYGFTNTQASLLITVRNLSGLCSVLAINLYYNRTDIRKGVAIALLAAVLSFLSFAFAKGYAMFCFGAVLAGFAFVVAGMIPVSIIISRWFDDRRALALGISAAGSGIATIVVPPALTIIIENTSVTTAFLIEAGLVLIIAAAEYLVLRNDPEKCGVRPYRDGKARSQASAAELPEKTAPEKKVLIIMLAALFLLGCTTNTGFIHLTVLFSKEGYDSMSIALAMSLIGCSLLVGKFTFGWVSDRFGVYRTNWIFLSLLFAGLVICSFAGVRRNFVMFAAALILGLGLSTSTVGISLWAAEMTDKKGLGVMLRRFQTSYLLGGLCFSEIPGMIADRTGSYVPAYVIFSVFTIVLSAIAQTVFGRRRGNRQVKAKEQ